MVSLKDVLAEEVLRMSTDEIISRARLLDNEVKIMKSEVMRISHELQAQTDKIKENTEKIKVNKTLPYLVSNVIEVCIVRAYNVEFFEAQKNGSTILFDFIHPVT